jgi:putative transposase
MPYNPQVHHRRSIRLKGYDYTLPGAYFVTLVAWQRECLFGTIQDDESVLSQVGNTVAACWRHLPAFFAIRLDEWVIMPNHFHGILLIEAQGKGEASASAARAVSQFHLADAQGKGEASATAIQAVSRPHLADASPQRPIGTPPGSLGAIVQNFKSITTRKINQLRHTPGVPVWQHNYYERIIRDEAEWDRIRQYILDNPRRWQEDDEYV